MKERLAMLEELQEDIEILDELIWEAIMKVDEIYSEDFHFSSLLSKVSTMLENAREENNIALSEVLMEIEQYDY